MRTARVIVRAVAGLFLAAAIIVCVWVWIGRPGTTSIENWIGEYFVRVAQSHINPSLRWDRLDYQAPRTVVIDSPRLDANGVVIVAMKRLTIQLAAVPRQGAPLVIESAELESPVFTFQVEPAGRLRGWNDFLRSDAQRASVARDYRVSDVFRMRKLVIRDAGVQYRPPDPRSVLAWSHISATLNAAPEDDDPGWYRLSADVKREPAIGVSLRGRLNTDRFELELDPIHLVASLQNTDSSSFPPPISQWLRDREIQGNLDLVARGTLAPKESSRTRLAVQMELRDARVPVQEGGLGLDRLSAQAELTDETIDSRFTASLQGGQIAGTLSGGLTDSSANLTARIDGVELAGFNPLLQSTRALPRLRFVGGRLDADVTVLLNILDTTRSSIQFSAKAGEAEAHIETTAIVPPQPASTESVPNVRLSELRATGVVNAERVTLNLVAPLPAGSVSVNVSQDRAAGLTEIDISAERADIRNFLPFLPPDWLSQIPASSVGGLLTGQARIRRAVADSSRLELTVAARAEDARASLAQRDLRFTIDDLQIAARSGSFEVRSAVRIGTGSIDLSLHDAPGEAGMIDAQAEFTDLEAQWVLDLARHHLPSELELRGRVSGHLSGRFSPVEWSAGTGRATFRLGACELGYGGVQVAMSQAELTGDLRDRALAVDYRIAASSGVVNGKGQVSLRTDGGAQVSWDASGVDLAQAVRSLGLRESNLAGTLHMTGDLAFTESDPVKTLTGSTAGRIENASLTEVPIVSEIAKLVRTNVAPLVGERRSEDRVMFRCAILSDCLDFQQLDFNTVAVGARSTGRVGYDGRVKIQVRAVPLGGITALLGPVGKLFDEGSGRLFSFDVSGTMSHPRIVPSPLGLRVP